MSVRLVLVAAGARATTILYAPTLPKLVERTRRSARSIRNQKAIRLAPRRNTECENWASRGLYKGISGEPCKCIICLGMLHTYPQLASTTGLKLKSWARHKQQDDRGIASHRDDYRLEGDGKLSSPAKMVCGETKSSLHGLALPWYTDWTCDGAQ